MNKEFKVGDIVVLVEGNYLNNLETLLAKEKHMFEVESLWDNDKVNLKSISTNIKASAYVEEVRHATLKEQYLRTGNSIVIDDIGYLVTENEIIGLTSGFDINYFCDDLLTVDGRIPITKVFNSLSREFENKIDVNHKYATVLWEQKPKIELTSDEVVILKNVNEKYKYIARDKRDRILAAYEEEPIKNDDNGTYVVGDADGDLVFLYAFEHLFHDITFEIGPHLIADLIKDNEKWN